MKLIHLTINILTDYYLLIDLHKQKVSRFKQFSKNKILKKYRAMSDIQRIIEKHDCN